MKTTCYEPSAHPRALKKNFINFNNNPNMTTVTQATIFQHNISSFRALTANWGSWSDSMQNLLEGLAMWKIIEDAEH
jgi:CRISPR/Cas system CMR-associated protein Cmr1 (group 7 of RAMP superfamily)